MYQYLLLLDTKEEKEFFREIYNSYKDEMYRAAYRILQNRSDAEDIVHETFLTLTEHLDGMMEATEQKNWNFIFTIVKHKCYNLYKKKKWEIETEESPEDLRNVFEEGLEVQIVKMEKKELILKLVKEMKQSYQDVLMLQYYHELDAMEISEILDTTPDNVRHISMRAKKKMHDLLDKYGISDRHDI